VSDVINKIEVSMRSEHIDNMQYVFACVATHSKWANKIVNSINELYQHFNLPLRERKRLSCFFSQYGTRIVATAVLMEEKRWADVLPAIQYTVDLFSKNTVKTYWAHYLSEFDVKELIPSTPIKESIKFLNFILSQPRLTHLQQAVVEYELYKNIALDFDFKQHGIYSKMENDNMKKHAINIDLNPSLIIKKFNIPISDIIKNIHSIKESQITVKKIKLNEVVAFYKDMKSNRVKTIILKDEVCDMIAEIDSVNTRLSQKYGASKYFCDSDNIIFSEDCQIGSLNQSALMKILFKNNLIYSPVKR